MSYYGNGTVVLDLAQFNLGLKDKKGVIRPLDHLTVAHDAGTDCTIISASMGGKQIFSVSIPGPLFHRIIGAMRYTSLSRWCLVRGMKI